jgi:hypothetical protein
LNFNLNYFNMKNFILAISIIVFSLNSNAQVKKAVVTKSSTSATIVNDNKAVNEVKAQKNIADLKSFTPLTDEMSSILLGLFKTKFKMLDEAGSTIERRQVVNQIIERKLEATLDGATFEKIKSNAPLFKSLVE